jgi:hypothetical protein
MKENEPFVLEIEAIETVKLKRNSYFLNNVEISVENTCSVESTLLSVECFNQTSQCDLDRV